MGKETTERGQKDLTAQTRSQTGGTSNMKEKERSEDEKKGIDLGLRTYPNPIL